MENYKENKMEDAYFFMKNDYLNTYASTTELLNRPSLIEKYKQGGNWPPKLKSFSERYKNMQFNTSASDQEKIKELDELSFEANCLLNEPEVNLSFFLDLAIKASEICGRPDIAEIFKNKKEE